MANSLAEMVVIHSDWDSEEILRKVEDIAPFQMPFREDEIRFMLRNDRLMVLDYLQHFPFFREHVIDADLWEWFKQRNANTGIRRGYAMIEINRAFDEMERRFFEGLPKPERGFSDIDNIFWFIAWYGKYAGIPTAIGRMMGDLVVPTLDAARASFTTRRATAAMTRLVFALEAYHRDNGNYPEALDDLLEHYIDELPLDPFSGEAFRYIVESEGYLLYSVGPNGIDEDGRGRGDDPRGDDIRRRVPSA
jgi:hypothetical protein